MMRRPIRVLHCPFMVGGNPQELARAERRAGIDSVAVAFDETVFRYATDRILWKNDDETLVREIKRAGLLLEAVGSFDIVHFNFGSTLLPMYHALFPNAFRGWRRPYYWLLNQLYRVTELLDLSLLKWAGKGIVVTFQGDDARQGDYCRNHFDVTYAHHVDADYFHPEMDEVKRRRIRRFDACADRIFALNPDLLHVLPARAEFLPYASVNMSEWRLSESSPEAPERPLRIVHAPSHRQVKGTHYLLEAVRRLKSEGLAFDFDLVEGVPHANARQRYEQADLLVDQLLAGWYGALAVECMALGKPVICYLRNEDLSFLPAAMHEQLPIVPATPGTIYDVLKQCLTTRRAELPAIGARARTFVLRWHDPDLIAQRLKTVYETIVRHKRAGAGGRAHVPAPRPALIPRLGNRAGHSLQGTKR